LPLTADKIRPKSTVFLTKIFAAEKGSKFYAKPEKVEPQTVGNPLEALIFM